MVGGGFKAIDSGNMTAGASCAGGGVVVALNFK